jgi:type IV secretion system protein VirB7
MNISKNIMVFGAVLLLAGCTTAGPYVTNISSDGANGLTIEKCKVELNAFLGVISTGDCSNSALKLTNPNR